MTRQITSDLALDLSDVLYSAMKEVFIANGPASAFPWVVGTWASTALATNFISHDDFVDMLNAVEDRMQTFDWPHEDGAEKKEAAMLTLQEEIGRWSEFAHGFNHPEDYIR